MRKTNLVHCLAGVVLVVFLMLGSNPPSANSAPVSANTLLNFRVGGQVLGFRANEFLISNATYALHVQFVGANAVTPQSDTPAPSDTGLAPIFERVTYPNLWHGITLEYSAVSDGLAQSRYRVEPGAAVSAIRLRYNSAVTLNEDGTLTTTFATGAMTESAPVAWQEMNGRRAPIAVAFQTWDDTVGFRVGAYDPAYPLFIDPILSWNTFLGGTGADLGYGIAVDGSGNIYVAGSSGASWGSPVRGFTSGAILQDAFVAKLDASGNLVWNTFLGGTAYDGAYAVAVDASGNTFVTGYSTATWGSPPSPGFSGGADAFVAKLDSSGTLQWNTFLGGTSNERGFGIAVDGSGNIYVTGYAWSPDWPGCPADTCRKRAYSVGQDGFAAKLAPDGSLTWNNFLGGTGTGNNGDQGSGIAVDKSGNVYVAGYSQLPWGSPVRGMTSVIPIQDAFVAKFAADGTLTANTFLGGNLQDSGLAITIDSNDNVYVAGYSNADWGSPVRTFSVGGDAYVAKLDSNLGLTWHTFVGGSGNDVGYAIAVDGSGNTFVAGKSNSTWGSPLRAFTVNGTNTDAGLASVDSSGNLRWNTFLGGTGADQAQAVAVDANKNVYVTGYGNATWGSPVRAFTVNGTNDDAFVAKMSPTCIATSVGNWNTTTTWDCGSVPTTGDNVHIPTGANVTLDTNTALLANVNITGTLQHNSAAHTLALTGNWSNGGTFTPGSYIGVQFKGTSSQTIGGSVPSSFFDVFFDVPTRASLGQDITVNGTLTLNSDITTTASYRLYLVASSNVTGAKDVVGTVRRANPGTGSALQYNNQFTTINNAHALSQLDVTLTKSAPSSFSSAVSRRYTITPGTGAVNATAQLAYQAPGELNGNTEANLKLWRYDTNTSRWVLKGGTVNTTNHFVALDSVTQFSDWAIASNGTPTAVTLSQFEAKPGFDLGAWLRSWFR